MSIAAPRPEAVFLNVPFDAAYEPKFVALVTAVVVSGLQPRCALELPERGEGQFRRIVTVLRECRLSVHELSRRGRLNMPFELGLAAALQAVEPRHRRELILLDARRGKLARDLSDLRVEPLLHGHGALRLLAVMLDNLGARVRPRAAERLYRALMLVVPKLKREYRTDTVFSRVVFEGLVLGAIEGATELKLLAH